MATQERGTTLDQFAGMVTYTGDFAGPKSGASEQVNLMILAEGLLEARQGFRDIVWDN